MFLQSSSAPRADDAVLFPLVSRMSCAFTSDVESDGEGFLSPVLQRGGRLVRANSDPSVGGDLKVSDMTLIQQPVFYLMAVLLND